VKRRQLIALAAACSTVAPGWAGVTPPPYPYTKFEAPDSIVQGVQTASLSGLWGGLQPWQVDRLTSATLKMGSVDFQYQGGDSSMRLAEIVNGAFALGASLLDHRTERTPAARPRAPGPERRLSLRRRDWARDPTPHALTKALGSPALQLDR
jgi:hypothetical protein